jgi:hypothetical protein
MVRLCRLKPLTLAVVLLLSFGAFILASGKAQAKEQPLLASPPQYPVVTTSATPQSSAAPPSVDSPTSKTVLIPETPPSDSTPPNPIGKLALSLDLKPTMEPPAVVPPFSYSAPPVEQPSSELVTEKPIWPAPEDMGPNSPPILDANYSKVAVDDTMLVPTPPLELPKTERERVAFCVKLSPLVQAKTQPDMRQLYKRLCTTPDTKVESTPSIEKPGTAVRPMPKPAAPFTLPKDVLLTPRKGANEVTNSPKSTHAATSAGTHKREKRAPGNEVTISPKSINSATSAGTHGIHKREKSAPDQVPALAPNIVSSMEPTANSLASLEIKLRPLWRVAASATSRVLPTLASPAYSPEAFLSETPVALDDTPSPASPLTPLENGSPVMLGIGQASSGSSTVSLLIGVLATGWFVLLWPTGLLLRVFCVFSKPSSTLLMPLERPG